MSTTLKLNKITKKKTPVRKIAKYSLLSYFKPMKMARTKQALADAIKMANTVFMWPRSKPETGLATTTVKKVKNNKAPKTLK
jgi:hypothetical protein